MNPVQLVLLIVPKATNQKNVILAFLKGLFLLTDRKGLIEIKFEKQVLLLCNYARHMV
jgi:hypothetical protein